MSLAILPIGGNGTGANNRPMNAADMEEWSGRLRRLSRTQALDGIVRANPWKALADTGFIGFLLGLLARRR